MSAANDQNDDTMGRKDRTGDVGAADEQALVALFAALVQDAEPSGLSPLKAQELARNEERRANGQRTRRLRITRNVLVAAVIVAVLVLVFPRLLPESGSTTAGVASSSASAAMSAAAPVASAAAAPPPAAATRAAAPSSAAAGSSGRVGGALGEGTDDRENSASAGPQRGAGTSAAASAASSGAAASGGPVPTSAPASSGVLAGAAGTAGSSAMSSDAGGSAGGCRLLPGKSIAAVRAAFPAGYFGAAARVSTCGGYGAQLNAGSPEAVTVVVLVRKAPAGACRTARSGGACPEEPVAAGVFRRMTAGGAPQTWVYGGGYEVYLNVAGRFPPKVEPDRLVAAGRSVIEALG